MDRKPKHLILQFQCPTCLRITDVPVPQYTTDKCNHGFRLKMVYIVYDNGDIAEAILG